MINSRSIKAGFLTAAVCLAGLSVSDMHTSAGNDGVEARLFSKIEIAADRGQLKEAKEDIQRVLRLNPRHPGATFYAGQYSFEAGNFANAEKFLQRVINHATYGARASRMMADIRMNSYRGKFKETLEVYLSGESYPQALKLCEEALESMPENREVLFKAAYIASMLGMRSRADKYVESYAVLAKNDASSAELRAFVDAWFAEGYEAETALEKMLAVSDRNLLTVPVRKRIKELIVSTRATDKFAEFIQREKKVPGADIGSLERELISFLIEQNQYEKALELVNRRPVDSLDDNLLYVKILSHTGQEKKAMSTARHLMSAATQDLRIFQAWIEAWIAFVEKYQVPPDGEDDGGKNFIEMADEILERLKPDKLITLNPELLINLLRMAVVVENEEQVKLIRPEVAKIPFNDQLAILLIKACDELMIFNRGQIAVDLLESARNQLPDNYNLHIKLAEIHLSTNPQAGAKILEGVLQEKPDLLRAFLLWADCMNLSGQGDAAAKEIIRRLEAPDASELIKRQLNAKLEVLRMQNFVNDGSQAGQEQTGEPDSTVPQRDLSPIEPSQEEMDQIEEQEPEEPTESETSEP